MKAVAIINYQSPQFLTKQLCGVSTYLKPDKVLVVDTSRNTSYCKDIVEIATFHGAEYLYYSPNEGDYSSHHGMALNYAYLHLRSHCSSILLMDHDMFPFRDIDFFNSNQDTFAGVHQQVNGAVYLHPGLILINRALIPYANIDFRPMPGLDTGGRLFPLIAENTHRFLDVAAKDDYEIIEGAFMHFIKGCNWQNDDRQHHEQRIKRLFKTLHENSIQNING